MESRPQKKIQKEKPGASKSDGTQSDENTLDSSIYLTYDILRIIFQYLDARNLASAAMVCRSWLEAANNEKWTRGPYCFIQHYNPYCLRDIQNIRIKPSAGFFFIPENTPRHVVDDIELMLPDHCETEMLFSKGVIMDNKEMECPFPNIVCVFLPQIPDVRIKTFKMKEHCIVQETAEYQEIISTIVNHKTSMSNHETSTCFMLFCNDHGHTTAKCWASAMQKSKENIVSVWGGVLLDICTLHTDRKIFRKSRSIRSRKPLYGRIRADCIAVLITGHIQTWSTILEKKCNTKERIEARLKLFKDEVKLKKHSIGFMFACKARGTEMHEEANVESTIFKRLFPKVPLAGCFGYGEFGKVTTVDEVNEEKNDKEERTRKKPKSWYNEFSTVFLILTYG